MTGHGFYMFATPAAALWSAVHYGAPYLTVVYQNWNWATGTLRTAKMCPDGFAQRSGLEGGYFYPPMHFDLEAQACGAYGENVRDPAQLRPALLRRLDQVRAGKPAVISVWLPRHLQPD